MLLVLGLYLVATAAFAGDMPFRSRVYKSLYERKVLKMQAIWMSDMEKFDGYYKGQRDNASQDSKNLFFGAKEVATKNKSNFNAQYNYGLLSYYIVIDPETGFEPTAAEADEAYRIFRDSAVPLAKSRGQKWLVYSRMIDIQEYKLFGSIGVQNASTRSHYSVYKQQKNHNAARILLDLRTKRYNADPNLQDAQENETICEALNRKDEAKQWAARKNKLVK